MLGASPDRSAAVKRLLAAAIPTLLFLACNEREATGPLPQNAASASASRTTPSDENEARAPGVTALTWNVYAGAEVERVLQAQTPDEAVAIATQEWANVQATNFPARAGRIAEDIAARRPHVVGLEEVALYRTTDRPFEELATRVAYDFVQLVVDSLAARHVHYVAAAVDRTTDVQVPVIAGFDAAGQPILAGVRYTDGDAVLVRSDVPYANARSGRYAANQPVNIGGAATVVSQGWSSVAASVDGRTYRFVATHLAGQEVQAIQVAQTQELLALLAAESRPTILVGDFNSDVYGADPTRATPTYPMVVAAGFADAWRARDRHGPGLTCCEQPDLKNPQATFDQRIDFIFSRHLPRGTRVVRDDVFGDQQRDKAGDLWPSDHGGVSVTFAASSSHASREYTGH